MPVEAKPREAEDPYTVAEYARKKRISLSVARKQVTEGLIPSYRIGRQYRIPASAVDDCPVTTARAESDLDAYIRELVKAAPKLSARQRNRLATLIGGTK